MKIILQSIIILNFLLVNLSANIYIMKDDSSGTSWGYSWQGSGGGGSYVNPSGNIPNDSSYNYNTGGLNSLLIDWGYDGSTWWVSYFRGNGTGEDAEAANNILNDCSLADNFLVLWIRATNTSVYPHIRMVTNSGGTTTGCNELSLSNYGSFQANQWARFVIPVADFGVDNNFKQKVYGIKFFNGDTGTNKMWVDYVYFTVSTNDYTPPIISAVNFTNNEKLSVYSNLEIKIEDTNTIVNQSSITMTLIQNDENNGTISTQVFLVTNSNLDYNSATKILKYTGSIISNGTISVYVSAKDCVENYTNKSFTITVAMAFSIYDEYNEVPENNFEYTIVGDNTFKFSGVINGSELYINNSKVIPDSSGNYEKIITLTEGNNTVSIARVSSGLTNSMSGIIKYYNVFNNDSISYIGSKTGTSLYLPYNSVDNGNTVNISIVTDIPANNNVNVQTTSKAVNVSVSSSEFNTYATLKIKVDSSFLDNYEKEKLKIFYYNNNEWIGLATKYDKDNMVFSSKILSAGIYVLCVDNRDTASIPKINNVPEVFTPNKDGVNDKVNIYVKINTDADADVKLKIYNLKGDLIYESSEIQFNAGVNTFQWNGYDLENKVVSDGVYIYTIEIKSSDNTYNIYKGTVTVVTP